MSTYRIGRKEAIKDAINRGAVFVLVIAAIATGATSHEKKAFTMLYIFVSTESMFLIKKKNTYISFSFSAGLHLGCVGRHCFPSRSLPSAQGSRDEHAQGSPEAPV